MIVASSNRRHTVVPSLQPTYLKEEGGFKASVLQELSALGDLVDLRPLVREYVVGIFAVHQDLRARWADKVNTADSIIREMIDRYKEVAGDDTLGLAAVRRDDDNNTAEAVSVFDEPIERRRWLMMRNAMIAHVDKHFVICEPKHRINGG